MKFYIPLLTLNFNDLISTESISPKKFYNQRNFGTNRHFETNLSLNEEFITLYRFIPNKLSIEPSENLNLDFKPMVLSVEIDKSDDKLVKINKDVYIYYGSIYIDCIKALFYDKDDFKETILKTKYIKEVKMKRLNMGLVNKNITKKIDIDISRIKELISNNKNIIYKDLVYIDELIDKVKGFYYYNAYNNNKCFIKPEKEKQIEMYDKYYEFMTYVRKENIKGNKQIISQLEENLKKNNIYKFKKTYKSILNLNKKNIINLESINEVINFSNSKDKSVFNIIINNLLVNQKGRQEYYSVNELKKIFTEIGSEINSRFGNKSTYRNDLKKIYNRFINEKIDIYIDSLENNVMKSFYVAVLKYDNIEELDLFLLKNNIKCNFMAYSFVGIINGFSDCSKTISNKVNNYNTHVLIPNQITNIKDRLYSEKNINTLYKKDIYMLVGKLKNENNRFKLINYAKSSNESIYTFKNTGNILYIYIDSNTGKYRIALYKAIYRNKYNHFLKEINKLGISKRILDGKYKYFKISVLDKDNIYDLNLENEKNIKELLRETINNIN